MTVFEEDAIDKGMLNNVHVLLDYVLVDPGSHLGQILKRNERVFSETGELEVVNDQSRPKYAVLKHIVHEFTRLMRKTEISYWLD